MYNQIILLGVVVSMIFTEITGAFGWTYRTRLSGSGVT